MLNNADPDFMPEHQDCPGLFIVGARKGGTTSLIQYLSKHPNFAGIGLNKGAQAGESFYFGTHYKKMTWEMYKRLLPKGGVMSGDSSVENLVHPQTPRRIYKACGKQPKVVMLFRDPIQRMMSNLWMRARLHTDGVSQLTNFKPLVARQIKKFLESVPKGSVTTSNLPNKWSRLVGLFPVAKNMIFEGLYYVHLLNWLCNFPAENILVINSEEFFQSPGVILDRVVQFLGLRRLDSETYDNITSASYNSGSKYEIPDYQKLSRSARKSLMDIFRPFNRALFKLLQWRTSLWQDY